MTSPSGQPVTDAGEFASRFPKTSACIKEGMDSGLHRGVQFWLWHHGSVVADMALGDSGPDGAMRTDTLMPWRSCTKPITAVALAQIWEQGKLNLDDPVAKFIPAFGVGGKDAITIRHLLTHTGGIRRVVFDPKVDSWSEIISSICAVPLEPGWTPGRRAAYHVRSSWYLLGEIVRVVDGRPFDQYVRESVFLPLGMKDSWIGVPEPEAARYGTRLGVLWDTVRRPAIPDPDGAPRGAIMCSPGASGHGPMRELGRFYLCLLHGGTLDGVRILGTPTVEALVARHRVGLHDETFMHRMDWGLGFILNSNRHGPDTVPYGFGLHSSPRAFGHGGAQSSSSFADPEFRIVGAAVFNGTPGDARHNRRIRNFWTAVYDDLGVAWH